MAELVPLTIFVKDLRTNTKLIEIINRAEENCFGSSIIDINNLNFGKYNTQAYALLILIFKRDFATQFDNKMPTANEKIRALEENYEAKNKILGHAIVKYDNSRKIGGIYNVCKHESARGIPNYGKKMFKAILEGCRTGLPHGCLLWLGIDIKNNYIDKVVNIYTSFGFKNPYASTLDIFEQPTPQPFAVCLMSTNTYLDKDNIDTNVVITEIKYCIQQGYKIYKGNVGREIIDTDIIKSTNQELYLNLINCCSVAIVFDLKYAEYLYELLFITSNLVQKNNNWDIVPSEIAGALDIGDPRIIDDYFIWTVIDDNVTDTKIGDVQFAVETVDNNLVGSYHTHPFAYLKDNPFGMQLDYGPPSIPDYIGFIIRALQGEMFSAIVTPEGIYIFCLNAIYSNSEEVKKLEQAFTKFGTNNYMKYLGEDNIHPTGAYGSLLKLPGAVACRRLTPQFDTPVKAGREFARQVELIPAFPSNHPYFAPIVKCQLISWEDARLQRPIFISYPQISPAVCTPNRETKEYLKIIYGFGTLKKGITTRYDRRIKNLQRQLEECNIKLRASGII